MNVSRAVVRQFSTTNVANAQINKGLKKLKDLQKHFQKADGRPVWLKGGTKDQVTYRLTMGLCVVGLLVQIKMFYELAIPKAPE